MYMFANGFTNGLSVLLHAKFNVVLKQIMTVLTGKSVNAIPVKYK